VGRLAVISTRLFQGAFLCLALFIPFSIAGENIAIGFGVLAWMLWVVSRRGRVARPDGLFVASVVLVVSALPSVWMSENRARALSDWQSYWQLFLCFLVGAHIARVKVREKSVAVLLASAAASCGVAFVQRAGGLDLGPLHIGAEHRVSSTMFTMTLAGILCQLVPFGSAVAASEPARRRRFLLVLALGMMFAALLLTMTRGAWIAVIAGLAVTAVVLRSRELALCGVLALAALALFSQAYRDDQGRTLAVDTFATRAADRNVSTRLVLWDMSWKMFLDHPWLGVGMGDYSIEAQKRLAGRAVRTTVDSHNVFLQVLATRGLLGFLPFIAYLAVLVRSLWRSMRASPAGSLPRHYAAGALGAAAAIVCGALTENNIDDEEVFAAFMFLVGVARSGDGNDPRR
jgi:putative inorganic carbon (HCO3(-)) transporter